MRVLVVEDEKKVASFIAKGFEQEGHAVDLVHDGEAGSHQAINFEYDVVVLDVMLPKRSGFEAVSDIRAKKPRLLPPALRRRRAHHRNRLQPR